MSRDEYRFGKESVLWPRGCRSHRGSHSKKEQEKEENKGGELFFSSIPVRESNSSGDIAKYPAKTITSHFCVADFCSFIANPIHIRV